MSVLFSAVLSASLLAEFARPQGARVRRDGAERFFERNVYSWSR